MTEAEDIRTAASHREPDFAEIAGAIALDHLTFASAMAGKMTMNDAVVKTALYAMGLSLHVRDIAAATSARPSFEERLDAIVKRSVDEAVASARASIEASVAVTVRTPQTVEGDPWYPDDSGQWVEHEPGTWPKCKPGDDIFVLTRRERGAQRHPPARYPAHAIRWQQRGDDAITAYRVMKPDE